MAKGRGIVYTHLLKDEDIKRWYNNVARGSVITADVYLRRLGKFCKDYEVTPQKLLRLNDKERHNLLLDAVSDLDEAGKAGKYIAHLITAIKSWLEYNGKTITRKIKITGTTKTPTLGKERTPTQPELKKILLAGHSQARVACAFLAFSGLRPQSLGSYKGTDGLKISDFPELEIMDKDIKFNKSPTLVIVRPELSKAGHQYLTFMGEEACEYLRDYLFERTQKGEKLTEDSAIITPKIRTKSFISSTNVGDIVRKALRTAGFPWRPYVLRSYFDTQLMLAESKGLVIRDYRTFWMGHKGDIEHTYTTNKGILPEHVIEDMREAYRRSQEFLQINTPESPRQKDLKRMFRIELLNVAGYTDEEIANIRLDELSDDEFKGIIRERLLGTNMPNGNGKQLAVGMDALDKYLSDGWEYVTTLPNDKIIIRAPY